MDRPSWRSLFLAFSGVAVCACSREPRNVEPANGTQTTDNPGATSDSGIGATSDTGGVSTTMNTGSSNTGGASASAASAMTGTSASASGVGGAAAIDSATGATLGTSGTDGGMGGASSSMGGTSSTATDGVAGADNPGPCTESEPTSSNASGSGPHEVIVETNADPGINEGTIFRPADLGGDERYPIFVWGQGGCSQNGLSNATAMAEIASYGYFVVADGTPNGSGNRTMDRSDLAAMGAPLIAYIDWAIAENSKPCSAYYHSLDTAMIAANGFSCGGLMAQGTVTDPRIVTWGVTSSGMAGANQAFYDLIHTPVLFVEGGPDEVAYDGGLEGYEAISQLGVPVLWFSKNIGHGGDLFESDGGDFTKINLAWLNWWLKGDETTTGKGALVGASCSYCSDSEWEIMSANLP